MTLDEVLDAHGKATDAEYSDAYEEDKPDLLDLTYRKENTDGNNYVRLTFEQKDGVYVLKSASATSTMIRSKKSMTIIATGQKMTMKSCL